MMKKIVLAIDDDLTRLLYKESLKLGGFEIEDCEDRKKLFEILKKNPDLLLLDLSLEGNQGFEIFQEVKKNYPQLPIFILSTFETDEFREKAKKEGAKDFFLISLTPPKELVLKIKMFFREFSAYQIEVNVNSPDLKLWAEDLGFLPQFYCTKCKIPLQMLLIKSSSSPSNYFKVVFICPSCRDIYFEKEEQVK